MQIEGVMHAFELAYKDLYKTSCRMTYRNGWYYHRSKRLRQSDVICLTAQMLAELHEQELNAPAECL